MKWHLFCMILITSASICFPDDYVEKINSLKNRGDIAGLQAEYDVLSSLTTPDAITLYHIGKTASFLALSMESKVGRNSEKKKLALTSIDYCKKAIAGGMLHNEYGADACFTVAEMYHHLIQNNSSFMQYNEEKQKYLKLCAEKEPGHLGMKTLSAISLLNMPEDAGGNPEKGQELLFALFNENPGNVTIMFEMATHLFNQDEIESATKICRDILRICPEHPAAMKMMDEISILGKRLIIQDIQITGKTKTPKRKILEKISSFIGKEYSFVTKREMIERIAEIKSIVDGVIEAEIVDDEKVNLSIFLIENNMMMLGVIGNLGVSLDYDKNIRPKGYPALFYMDDNFLGASHKTQIVFTGQSIKVDYWIPNPNKGAFPDIRLKSEAMLLDAKFFMIERGKKRDDLVLDFTNYSATLGIGKDFQSGFSAFVNARVAYENWKTDSRSTDPDVSAPSDHLVYNPYVDLSFSTISEKGALSKMQLLNGFGIRLIPELVYHPDYQSWGKPDELYEHDANPAWRFSADLQYYKTFLERHNLGVNIAFMTGANLYQTEMWSIGKKPLSSGGMPSLDGYFSDEFLFTTGAVGNIKYQFNIVPTKLSAYGKYDLFLDLDKTGINQGTALGIVMGLPFDIELTSQIGIGLDAERADGFGYEFDIMLTKAWFF